MQEMYSSELSADRFKHISDSEPRIFNDANAASPPDSGVHEIETAIAGSISRAMPKRISFPPRPGYGTLGQPNILHTNYLHLTFSDKRMFCYKIHIESTEPSQPPKAAVVRRTISELLAEQFREEMAQVVTDYHSVVISCVEIPWANTYRVTYPGTVRYPCVYPTRTFRVFFSPTGMLSSREFMNYLNATHYETDFQPMPQIMQALNVILGQLPRKQALSVGAATDRAFYGRQSKSLSLCYGPGLMHHLPIKAHAVAARVLVNVEVRYLPWHQTGRLSTMIRRYMSRPTSQITRLESFLRGIRIHIVASVRHYHGKRPGTAVQIIRGLATCNDGALLQHPPKVARYAAGPQDVKIFLDSRQTRCAASSLRRGYVTLMAYFEQGWLSALPMVALLKLTT